jgi:hypothetical protein
MHDNIVLKTGVGVIQEMLYLSHIQQTGKKFIVMFVVW